MVQVLRQLLVNGKRFLTPAPRAELPWPRARPGFRPDDGGGAMTQLIESHNGCARPVGASDIVLDAEFAGLTPPLSREERDRREFSLALEGCLEPLIVWPAGS